MFRFTIPFFAKLELVKGEIAMNNNEKIKVDNQFGTFVMSKPFNNASLRQRVEKNKEQQALKEIQEINSKYHYFVDGVEYMVLF